MKPSVSDSCSSSLGLAELLSGTDPTCIRVGNEAVLCWAVAEHCRWGITTGALRSSGHSRGGFRGAQDWSNLTPTAENVFTIYWLGGKYLNLLVSCLRRKILEELVCTLCEAVHTSVWLLAAHPKLRKNGSMRTGRCVVLQIAIDWKIGFAYMSADRP